MMGDRTLDLRDPLDPRAYPTTIEPVWVAPDIPAPTQTVAINTPTGVVLTGAPQQSGIQAWLHGTTTIGNFHIPNTMLALGLLVGVLALSSGGRR